jgi:hypothetical protein
MEMPWTVPLFLYSAHPEPDYQLGSNSQRETELTCNVTPDDSFNLDDFTFLDNHAPSLELITVFIE